MRPNLLVFLILLVTPLAGCTPKATVQRATPVANLRVYHGVMVRGASGNAEAWQGQELAQRTAEYIQSQCQFAKVFTGEPTTTPTSDIDLVIDLSVVGTSRGGSGFVKNPNVAVVDVSMALSDAESDELLGSASIRGQSPTVVTRSDPPERIALDAVAQQVTKMLISSGCQGQRLAKLQPIPVTEPPPVDPGISEEEIAAAEALSEEGKAAFRAGDPATAKAKFAAAIESNPDPRYVMNLCLAQEALKEYDGAIASCQRVVDAKAEPRLVEKAQARIELINELKSSGG